MYHIDRKKDLPDIGYMEARVQSLMKQGVRIADCTELINYYTTLRDELEADFIYKYGVSNPRSPKQLVAYLKNLASEVDLTSRNDIVNICFNDAENKWTTEAAALEKLADLGYDFARDLLDYRHAKKYAESILGVVKEADEDHLIHPKVSLGKTNRINYSDPGLLTIPKKLLWKIIRPFNESEVIYSVDIKNQEPHLLISMTGATELQYALEAPEGLYETMFKQCFQPTATANVMIDTFIENRVYTPEEIKAIGTISPIKYSPAKPSSRMYLGDKLITSIETVCVGSEKGVYPALPETVNVQLETGEVKPVKVKWNESEIKYKRATDYTVTGMLENIDIKITKAERSEFKTSWLAISYGSGAQNIHNVCKLIDGKRVWNYITHIEALKAYRKAIDEHARKGYTQIGTTFGTPLYAGSGLDKNKLRRVLLDLPIQGSGSDILSLLIMRCDKYTKEKGLENVMKLYYTRHDELIIRVDKVWESTIGQDKVIEILRDMFEHQIDDWVPFQIEISKIESEEISLDFDEDD